MILRSCLYNNNQKELIMTKQKKALHAKSNLKKTKIKKILIYMNMKSFKMIEYLLFEVKYNFLLFLFYKEH